MLMLSPVGSPSHCEIIETIETFVREYWPV